MARFRSKSSSRQQQQQKVDPIRASKTAGTTTTAMASTKGFPMWGRDELYKIRSSRKTESQQEKRSCGSPILLKIESENRFSGKTDFYTIASRRKEIRPPSSASSEDGGGCRCKEFMASQHIQQDMVSVKTYLHRLRRILQDAETATLNSQNVSLDGYSFPTMYRVSHPIVRRYFSAKLRAS